MILISITVNATQMALTLELEHPFSLNKVKVKAKSVTMDCTHTGNSIGNPKIYTDAEGLKELEGNASTNPNGLNTLPIDI
jgi:hypothetical protein